MASNVFGFLFIHTHLSSVQFKELSFLAFAGCSGFYLAASAIGKLRLTFRTYHGFHRSKTGFMALDTPF